MDNKDLVDLDDSFQSKAHKMREMMASHADASTCDDATVQAPLVVTDLPFAVAPDVPDMPVIVRELQEITSDDVADFFSVIKANREEQDPIERVIDQEPANYKYKILIHLHPILPPSVCYFETQKELQEFLNQVQLVVQKQVVRQEEVIPDGKVFIETGKESRKEENITPFTISK